MEETVQVIDSNVQAHAVINRTTLNRLFKLGETSLTLYMFFIETARRQAEVIGFTQKIKATGSYCCKGLGWGKVKYQKAKKQLVDADLISVKQERDTSGKMSHWYVIIHYLENQRVEKPTGGKPDWRLNRLAGNQATNAVNKKINAVDKKLNAVDLSNSSPPPQSQSELREQEAEEFLNHFNRLYEKKMKSFRALLSPVRGSKQGLFDYWRQTYSTADLLKALEKSLTDPFWSKVLKARGPLPLFRMFSPKGDPVDYIGVLLDQPEPKTGLDKFKEEASAELGFEVRID